MIIKVCGMRDPENIRQLSSLDIHWMGLIFYPKSPRYVDPTNCQSEIGLSQLSVVNCPLKKVGVFVNTPAEEIMRIAQLFRLDYLQLHGNETPDECYALQKRGYRIIKALPVATASDLAKAEEYEGRVDYLLFDTKCEGYGGSGESFNWTILNEYKGEIPFLLSGGINPESVESIRTFSHPQLAGIDLNSGFESAPALKDIAGLSSFIKQIKKL